MPQWFFVASALFYTFVFFTFGLILVRDFFRQPLFFSTFEIWALLLVFTLLVLLVGILALAFWFTVAGAPLPSWLAHVIGIMKMYVVAPGA